jgi:hypothetical protein
VVAVAVAVDAVMNGDVVDNVNVDTVVDAVVVVVVNPVHWISIAALHFYGS